MYHYLEAKREEDAHALPDVEIWRDTICVVSCDTCGEYDVPQCVATATTDAWCPSCGRACEELTLGGKRAWWYRFGVLGYMPDSDCFGPFESEAAAYENARKNAGYCPHGAADDAPCEACDSGR